MRRVLPPLSIVAGLAVAVAASGAPRGLLLAAIAAGIGVARTAYAAQSAGPHFDVVSIKRNTGGAPTSSMRPEPNGLTGVNITPMRLFRIAYQALDFQIIGAPAWFDAERYDIVARTAAGVPQSQLGLLTQALLADRFALRVERETREVAGFELRIDRVGHPGLKSSNEPCSGAPGGPGPSAGRSGDAAVRPCFSAAPGEIRARGVPLEMAARELAAFVGQPVVDRTELAGVFDFDLRWSEIAAGRDQAADAPPLVTALREQIGLRLVPSPVAIDAFVITRAERPTEN